MAGVLFDLATKMVANDQQIWAMFPGLGRKFFGMFADQSAIFLDTPGLRPGPALLADDDMLRRHVAMSQAWVKYYYDPDSKPPSNNPDDYEVDKNASNNAAVGNVRNVFQNMQVGDLVLVGAFGHYEPILIGEITEPYDGRRSVRYERYGNERIPFRRVNWLRTDVERRFLSEPLSRLLSNRRTVVHIDKQVFGEEIYRVSYGDYVSGAESRYIYEGPAYKNIALATVPGIDLISYFCAAFNAFEEDELAKFFSLDIQKATNDYFEQDVLYSFEIEFASPGSYVLHAKRAALPLLVAVLVAATSGAILFNDARTAQIENSSNAQPSDAGKVAAPDPCTLEIQEKYAAIMGSISADRFKQLCKMNMDAQHGVGLRTRIKRKR